MPKNKSKNDQIKLLSLLDYFVLLCVKNLLGKGYGMYLQEEVSKTYRPVGYGSVYASLQRLKKWEYTESVMGEATDRRGGKAIRYYIITELGCQALHVTHQRLAKIFDPEKERREFQPKKLLFPCGNPVGFVA